MDAHVEKLGTDRYRVHVGDIFATVYYSLQHRAFLVDFGDNTCPIITYNSVSEATADVADVLRSLLSCKSGDNNANSHKTDG